MAGRLRRWYLAARLTLRRAAYSRGSGRSVAGGAALGIFIGLGPTFGFQMIPAAFFAALLRVNIVAAVAGVWITNPFTVLPIYYFEYLVGKHLLGAEEHGGVWERLTVLAGKIGEVSLTALWTTMRAAFRAFLHLGEEILVPFLVGSIVTAVVGAAITYPLAFWAVKRFRRKRERRAVVRAEERLARLSAAGFVPLPPAPVESVVAPQADPPQSPQSAATTQADSPQSARTTSPPGRQDARAPDTTGSGGAVGGPRPPDAG